MIDGEQIRNWNGGPQGETLEELCAPISGKKMPRAAMYAQGHLPLSQEDALAESRKRAGQSFKMKRNRKGKR